MKTRVIGATHEQQPPNTSVRIAAKSDNTMATSASFVLRDSHFSTFDEPVRPGFDLLIGRSWRCLSMPSMSLAMSVGSVGGSKTRGSTVSWQVVNNVDVSGGESW